jgi:hypothetical protein
MTLGSVQMQQKSQQICLLAEIRTNKAKIDAN